MEGGSREMRVVRFLNIEYLNILSAIYESAEERQSLDPILGCWVNKHQEAEMLLLESGAGGRQRKRWTGKLRLDKESGGDEEVRMQERMQGKRGEMVVVVGGNSIGKSNKKKKGREKKQREKANM